MSERDFSIGERKFKLCKIDPFKQFHIVRRLGPILGDIIPVAQKIKSLQSGNAQLSEDQMFEQIALLATPIMNGLSKLSDEDANRVLLGLCSSVEMHQPQHDTWAKVAGDKAFMFQDLELPEILQIAGRAFAYNLSGFFPSAHPNSSAGR